MKLFVLYIIRCGDGSYYVGHTDDLETRMRQHSDRSLGGYTAKRHPLELVYACEFPTRLECLERERQIKRWSRAKKEALIGGDWAALKRLAKGRDRRRPSTPASLRDASAQGERVG